MRKLAKHFSTALIWTIAIAGGLLGLAAVVLWGIGRHVPEGHEVSASLRLERSPDVVWAAIADTASVPTWDHGVDRVERLADRDGKETWRWVMGRNSLVVVTTVAEPPTLLVRTIDDDAQYFSGDWTYSIHPDGTGSRLELVEHGRIHVAIPRALMGRFADPHRYLVRHLAGLASHFGEHAEIEKGPFRRIS